MKTYLPYAPAVLSSRVPTGTSAGEAQALRLEAEQLGRAAQYGWGHTINFGPFAIKGLLLDSFLSIAGGFDTKGWWPKDLRGLRVADVGCYTGGLAVLMAERGAETIYAIDEVPANLAQCAFLARVFQLTAIRPLLRTVYSLQADIPQMSLDLVVCSGVLYHLSDMLAGLLEMRRLLKPGGTLLLEGNGIDDDVHSYANFGRFCGGMWWQPTALCVKDMCEYMGYTDVQVDFYQRDRFIAKARALDGDITYKRGINARFEDLRDRAPRSLDPTAMAPAPVVPGHEV